MSRPSPYVIVLNVEDRVRLETVVRQRTASQRDGQRTRIVLGAADGLDNVVIAVQVGAVVNTVSAWRNGSSKKVSTGCLIGIVRVDPEPFPPLAIAEVKELACELPATSGVPLSRWSSAELARELITRRKVETISASTVWRILHTDAIRPWFHRSWIFPRDPDFAVKAGRALDLYARIFDGKPLGDDEFVVCADEKTSIQCRCRCNPTLPPGSARLMRVEHEYDRGGALAYLAAYDVHRAHVMGRCEPTTGIVPFGRLVEQVMTIEPYVSAKRVLWIVDNGSSHRGKASITRLEKAWPTLRLIHLPVHASWLDQCEIYFSVVQRKVVNPNDFTHQISERLAAFEIRYNARVVPFDWKFGRDDLDKLIARIDLREQAAA